MLVIEAGKFSDESSRYLFPAEIYDAGTGNYWPLTSAPIPGLNNRTTFPLAGRIIGGGSAVNGMFFDRGAPGDYDLWGELIGDSSWSWKGLLPYFMKSESFTPPTEVQQRELGVTFDMSVHGTTGPVRSSFPPWIYDHHRRTHLRLRLFLWGSLLTGVDLGDLIVAAREVGIPVQRDGGGNAIGAFWVTNSLDPVLRQRSYARDYHRRSAKRPNYHIITESLVTKLTFDRKGSISGVEFVPYTDPTLTAMPRDIVKTRVLARKEVIMAAGAVHTPKILQLSGIGPKKLLKRLGIKQTINLPGVGENFQDHPGYFSSWNTTFATPEMDPTLIQTDPAYREAARQQYLHNRTGPYTVSSGSSVLFLTAAHLALPASILTTAAAEPPGTYALPDTDPSVLLGYATQKTLLARHFRAGTMAVQETVSGGTGLGGFLAHPFTRGRITAVSPDPFAMPLVNWNALAHPADLAILLAGLRWQNDVLANAPVNRARHTVPTVPAAGASEGELEGFVRQMGFASGAHLTCSCAMMRFEEGGCVDAQLRVYGAGGRLRIVDASVMPVVPGTHTQSTVYAVAEKAADIIKRGAGGG